MSSNGEFAYLISLPVTALEYHDVARTAMLAAERPEPEISVERLRDGHVEMSEAELAQQLDRARTEAAVETERKLRVEYDARSKQEAEKLRLVIERFGSERSAYYAKAEAELVRLSLAIAGKILHREAQVDPMLTAALVRLAVEKLHDGSRVTIRVRPEQSQRWTEFFSRPINGITVEVMEDAKLAAGDCWLDTELGSANFSLDAQLKEVERGFFDLLAHRPGCE